MLRCALRVSLARKSVSSYQGSAYCLEECTLYAAVIAEDYLFGNLESLIISTTILLIIYFKSGRFTAMYEHLLYTSFPVNIPVMYVELVEVVAARPAAADILNTCFVSSLPLFLLNVNYLRF